jgi:hypothetical protein
LSTIVGSDPITAFLKERNISTVLDRTIFGSASSRCGVEPEVCYPEEIVVVVVVVVVVGGGRGRVVTYSGGISFLSFRNIVHL